MGGSRKAAEGGRAWGGAGRSDGGGSRAALTHARTTPTQRRADEDPVDVKPMLEEECKPKCAKFLVRASATAPSFPATSTAGT